MKEKIININTEEINKINIRKTDYLKTLRDVSNEIRSKLLLSVVNKYNSRDKVNIVFRSKSKGLFRIKSQILMVGSRYVVLGGNKTLPIGSIQRIRL